MGQVSAETCPAGRNDADHLRYCDHCCPLGCDGGACESCPCCAAGWCLNGRDGLPVGENQWGEAHVDFWRELRTEHGITTPEPEVQS